MANKWATVCKKCGKRVRWDGAILPIPPCPWCAEKVLDATVNDDAADAAEQCERIIEKIDSIDWPDRGIEFAESVREQVTDVQESITRNNAVTQAQRQALDNWESGVDAWDH